MGNCGVEKIMNLKTYVGFPVTIGLDFVQLVQG